MAIRDGIFAGDSPFVIAQAWMDEAQTVEAPDVNAMALATVDFQGMPNNRVVLLKAIEPDGFVFFTNYNSAKGVELTQSKSAAFVLHWKILKRQIRVRGLVAKVSEEESDTYYRSRAHGSQIGAWASDQSHPLASREALLQSVEEAKIKHGMHPARPPHWGGYKITPLEIEFWADGEFRLHDRFVWRKEQPLDDWQVQRLNP